MAADVLIVADDLSGAADSAAACAVRGLRADVFIDPSAAAGADADVIALDADTRHRSPDEAAAETGRLVRVHGRVPWCFKKIDSTLRGHAGVEIAAALTARRGIDHRAVVIMAPAFPATGRTTVDGCQRVDGVPLEGTEHWARERRTEDSHVGRLLERAGMRVTLVGLAAVRSGDDRLTEVMTEGAAAGDALVCDAETDADLRAVARAASRLPQFTVWAGSAGLAACLPDVVERSRKAAAVAAPAARGPLLFVIGSPAASTSLQADVLAAEAGMRAASSPAPDAVARALASGDDVIVRPASIDETRALAPAAAAASGLVLTGGETARALLVAMRVTSLHVIDEVERGVPRSLASLPLRVPVVTKAGAFGDRSTLVRCRAALRNLHG
jgi:4-hydroxythreonine-4-phosphate dehydrogenase